MFIVTSSEQCKSHFSKEQHYCKYSQMKEVGFISKLTDSLLTFRSVRFLV